MLRELSAAIVATILLTGVAHADPIVGNWKTEAGSTAKISPCGGGFCIKLISGNHAGKQIGMMAAAGSGYSGTITDPNTDKTPELLRAYGRFVESLGGRYVTACDVGTYVADMDVVSETTRFATGRSEANGGAGDSSVLTAYGVFQGQRACAQHLWGQPTLAGRTVGIAGVGKVGRILTVSPTNPMQIEAYEGTLFSDEEGSTELCTAQATIYSTFGVASLVANQVKRFARGESQTFEHIIDFSTSMLLTVD